MTTNSDIRIIGKYFYDNFKNFHFLLALIVVLWMNSGFFAYVIPYFPSVLIVSLYFIWFLIAIFDHNYLALVAKQMCFLFLFYGAVLFFYLFNFSFPEIYSKNYYPLNIFFLIILYSIFLYYYNNNYSKFRKIIVITLTADYTLIYLKTTFLLTRYPDISRILSMGVDFEGLGSELTKGVGNYSYFYGLVAIILFTVFAFIRSSRYRLILFITIIFLFKILIDASFTTSIILCLLFILVLVIKLYFPQYFWISLASLSLLLFVSMPFVADIFEVLAKTEWFSLDVSGRLIEMSDIFSKVEINPNSDSGTRIECYSISINTIQNNFILSTFSDEPFDRLHGGHSAWLDTIALYNVCGLFLFIFLIDAFNHIYNNIHSQHKVIVNILWIYFIVLGLINTLLFSPIFVVWFIYLPFILSLVNHKAQINLGKKG